MQKIPAGIFLNTAQANCSIYESGKMIYRSLVPANSYTLDYLEISEQSRKIPAKYDFYVFNYHPVTMAWLDTKTLGRLPGPKITFVLEVSPNDPFAMCPRKDFDAYCALDPTINIPDKRVYAFPRPLEVPNHINPYQEQPIPTIGSFGFATPGKGFELVVAAVNKEFPKAIIKINIPWGEYTNNFSWRLHKCDYSTYLEELCKKIAKPGIQVNITHDYMSKDDLITWCGQNTLNCFLYNRNQPGLSATTDQAISSGRPLAVSTNETFRHIHPYLKPYPFQNLQESIRLSQPQVLEMQKDWSPENFKKQFEKVLQGFDLFSGKRAESAPNQTITLSKKRLLFIIAILKKYLPTRLYDYLSERVQKQTQPYKQSSVKVTRHQRDVILLISSKKEYDYIYQCGLNISEALQKSSRYSLVYAECSNPEELRYSVNAANPSAIIYNDYQATMPWLNKQITKQFHAPQLRIMQEVTQSEADKVTNEVFDFHLCPDPNLSENNPLVFRTPRLIPPYINIKKIPDIITIGGLGFGFENDGFEKLIEVVQQEFDRARIILNISALDNDMQLGLRALATDYRCRKLIKKPGIKLTINHKFLSKPNLLNFLANNTINAFFYDTNKDRGISSVIDYALAVQRPIAVTKYGMFRHIANAMPSICIENSTLMQIIKNDIVPLVPFYNDWSEANFIICYEKILDKVLNKYINIH